MDDVLNDEDPPDSEWISYEDPNQGYVMVEFLLLCHLTCPRLRSPFLMILRYVSIAGLHELLTLCPL